jgi:glycine cleavage system aminomethyltransferase T
MEFWRDNMVDLDAGDFIGRAALRAIRDRGGPTRRMVGLKALDPKATLQRGEWDLPVLANGQQVGSTRRYVHSPALGRVLALAVVGRDHTLPGTRVVVEHPGGFTDMEVARLPFIDPDGRRARS